MGQFTQYSGFDPASGARISAPTPAHAGLIRPQWAPGNVQSDDPHNAPYDTGEKPSFGPKPENIVTRNTDDTDSDDDTDDDGADFDCAADDTEADDTEADSTNIIRGTSREALRQAGQAGIPGPISRTRNT